MHHLVAAYLGYKAPEREDEAELSPDAADAGKAAFRPPGWLSSHGRNLPPPPELAAAETPEEGLALLERMFFGEVRKL